MSQVSRKKKKERENMRAWLTVMWLVSSELQNTNTLSPSETSALQPLQDWLKRAGGGSLYSSGPIPVLCGHLREAEQRHQGDLSNPMNKMYDHTAGL